MHREQFNLLAQAVDLLIRARLALPETAYPSIEEAVLALLVPASADSPIEYTLAGAHPSLLGELGGDDLSPLEECGSLTAGPPLPGCTVEERVCQLGYRLTLKQYQALLPQLALKARLEWAARFYGSPPQSQGQDWYMAVDQTWLDPLIQGYLDKFPGIHRLPGEPTPLDAGEMLMLRDAFDADEGE